LKVEKSSGVDRGSPRNLLMLRSHTLSYWLNMLLVSHNFYSVFKYTTVNSGKTYSKDYSITQILF